MNHVHSFTSYPDCVGAQMIEHVRRHIIDALEITLNNLEKAAETKADRDNIEKLKSIIRSIKEGAK